MAVFIVESDIPELTPAFMQRNRTNPSYRYFAAVYIKGIVHGSIYSRKRYS